MHHRHGSTAAAGLSVKSPEEEAPRSESLLRPPPEGPGSRVGQFLPSEQDIQEAVTFLTSFHSTSGYQPSMDSKTPLPLHPLPQTTATRNKLSPLKVGHWHPKDSRTHTRALWESRPRPALALHVHPAKPPHVPAQWALEKGMDGIRELAQGFLSAVFL